MKRIFRIYMLLGMALISNNILFAQAEFLTGKIEAEVGSYGRIRLYTTAPADTIKHIERISILAGVSPGEVFDYYNDIEVEEPVVIVSPSQVADYEIFGAFNNLYSGAPPDILQKLSVYGWDGGGYVIVKNVLINREVSTINLVVGQDFIVEVDNNYGSDTISYDSSNQVIDTYRGGTHVGFKYLSHQLSSLISITYYTDYFADTSYWNWLNHGAIDEFFVAQSEGPVSIPALAPITLNTGDSITVYYAVAIGADSAAMQNNMNEAETKYNSITSISEYSNLVPAQYHLEQNYPNPFNPVTKISFDLPSKDMVTLKVFNMLGQEISTLINSELEAGKYIIEFNASGLPSGAYFYRITTGSFTNSKKMILTK